ncbi:MAG: YIP1 family protein [Bryobacteraceae bacterium]
MNEIRRWFNIYFNPPEAFLDIARRPRWWAPAIVIAILSMALVHNYGQRVGWDRVIRQAIETNSRAQGLSEAQKEQQIELYSRISGETAGFSALAGPFLFAIVAGGVYLWIFNLIGRVDLRFHQAAAVAAYSYLPMAISLAVSLAMLNLRSPDEFDIRNPNAFSLGYFLPMDSSRTLLAFAASMDLFSFWTLALLACGFAVATKIRFSKALIAVIVPWLLYLAVKITWVAAFS